MNADDKPVVRKIKEGDVLSFDQLFYKYHKKIYYFARCYLKNKVEAEEVTQDVFLNLWRFRQQINEDYDFNRYLFKVTYNAICKVFRKKASIRKQMDNILKDIIKEDHSTDLDIEYNNLVETVNVFIEQLPAQQKKVFLLSTKDFLDNDQIASKLNISLKTVENHLSNARAFLRKALVDNHILSLLFFILFIK